MVAQRYALQPVPGSIRRALCDCALGCALAFLFLFFVTR
jgi:hypothetical protein